MDRNPRATHLWQAVAAGAATLTALVALTAYLWPRSSASSAASAPSASAVAAASAGQDTTLTHTAQPHASSATSEPSAVLAHTTLRVSEEDGSGTDVGDLPLSISTNPVLSFWASNGEISAGIDKTTVIAPWSGSGQPTASGCADLLRTQPTSTNHAGLQFCMEGVFTHRVAAGRVLSYDGTVSQVDVTVWDTQLD